MRQRGAAAGRHEISSRSLLAERCKPTHPLLWLFSPPGTRHPTRAPRRIRQAWSSLPARARRWRDDGLGQQRSTRRPSWNQPTPQAGVSASPRNALESLLCVRFCCHAAQVNLDADDERNKEDLEAFIGALLDDVFEAEPPMARGKAAAELAQRADGLFQYAGFVARELEQLRKAGDSKLTLDAMLDMFPADLDKLYQCYLDRVFKAMQEHRGEDGVRVCTRLLSVLVALRAPVSFEDVLQPLMRPLLPTTQAAGASGSRQATVAFERLVGITKDRLGTVLEERSQRGGPEMQLHTAMLRWLVERRRAAGEKDGLHDQLGEILYDAKAFQDDGHDAVTEGLAAAADGGLYERVAAAYAESLQVMRAVPVLQAAVKCGAVSAERACELRLELLWECVSQRVVPSACALFGQLADDRTGSAHVPPELCRDVMVMCVRKDKLDEAREVMGAGAAAGFIIEQHGFNMLVHACAQTGKGDVARGLLREMAEHPDPAMRPDEVTYTSLLNLHVKQEDLKGARGVMEEMRAAGAYNDIYIHIYTYHHKSILCYDDIYHRKSICYDNIYKRNRIYCL